jgi:predicted nuclease of predicted toxin-antitoxin system
MKLLFDQNLSPRLVTKLADLFPGSLHVDPIGLGRVSDREVWAFAEQGGFIIVTKDVDFSELGLLLGYPPKVIWIRRKNCPTRDIEAILRHHYAAIELLIQDNSSGILTLF